MPASHVSPTQDVWAIWAPLPITRLRYPVLRWPSGLDPCILSRTLQGRVWQQVCTQFTPCVEQAARRCMRASENCNADWAFPLNLVNGKARFRMATVFVRWQPALSVLDILSFGLPREEIVLCIDREVRARFADDVAAVQPSVATLGELCPSRAGELLLHTLTPWVAGNVPIGQDMAARGETLAEYYFFKLRVNLADRAYKLTALALDADLGSVDLPLAQRKAICLASNRAAEVTLIDGLLLSDAQLSYNTIYRPSVSTELGRDMCTIVPYQVIEGRFTLRFNCAAWPWLALMQVCGSGESADEGWGAVNGVWAASAS